LIPSGRVFLILSVPVISVLIYFPFIGSLLLPVVHTRVLVSFRLVSLPDSFSHPIQWGFLPLLLIQILRIVEVELVFALGAEMVEILDDPLAYALLMEDMFAR
jgi:hypothetical protein